ncbi:MAG: hypothetical protein NTU57_00630 [Candidatus Aenigmarchaeota archaeon]|nr:hypothetical protein [Candidatus Aenigmarchaeota archaeon]
MNADQIKKEIDHDYAAMSRRKFLNIGTTVLAGAGLGYVVGNAYTNVETRDSLENMSGFVERLNGTSFRTENLSPEGFHGTPEFKPDEMESLIGVKFDAVNPVRVSEPGKIFMSIFAPKRYGKIKETESQCWELYKNRVLKFNHSNDFGQLAEAVKENGLLYIPDI